jgi:hypothetical protein
MRGFPLRLAAASLLLGAVYAAPAAAAPANTPTRARQTQNTYIYLYPSLNHLSFEQRGAIPLSFSSTTISALGLRGGYVLGTWAVEASASLAKYKINALVDDRGAQQSYTSRRLSVEGLRRVFANVGKLRLSGNVRIGLQSQTLPLVGAQDGYPLMTRVNSTNLSLGFALSSYLTGRTRLSLTAKWLPGIGLSGGPGSAQGLKNGFSYEVSLGGQHLLDNNWSVGLFANLQGAGVSGTMLDLDEDRFPMKATNSESSLQLVAGYQF